MNHPMTQNDHVRRAAVFRKVLEACKKEKVRPHCAAINGVVKKVGCMRIIHERLRGRAAATKQRAGSEHYEKARSEFRESFEEALRQPKGALEVPALGIYWRWAGLAELIKKAHDDLHLAARARPPPRDPRGRPRLPRHGVAGATCRYCRDRRTPRPSGANPTER